MSVGLEIPFPTSLINISINKRKNSSFLILIMMTEFNQGPWRECVKVVNWPLAPHSWHTNRSKVLRLTQVPIILCNLKLLNIYKQMGSNLSLDWISNTFFNYVSFLGQPSHLLWDPLYLYGLYLALSEWWICLKHGRIYFILLGTNNHTLFSMYKAIALFSWEAGKRLPFGMNSKDAFMNKALLHTHTHAHTQKKEHISVT